MNDLMCNIRINIILISYESHKSIIDCKEVMQSGILQYTIMGSWDCRLNKMIPLVGLYWMFSYMSYWERIFIFMLFWIEHNSEQSTLYVVLNVIPDNTYTHSKCLLL